MQKEIFSLTFIWKLCGKPAKGSEISVVVKVAKTHLQIGECGPKWNIKIIVAFFPQSFWKAWGVVLMYFIPPNTRTVLVSIQELKKLDLTWVVEAFSPTPLSDSVPQRLLPVAPEPPKLAAWNEASWKPPRLPQCARPEIAAAWAPLHRVHGWGVPAAAQAVTALALLLICLYFPVDAFRFCVWEPNSSMAGFWIWGLILIFLTFYTVCVHV